MIKNIIIGIAFVTGIAGCVIALKQNEAQMVFLDMGKLYDNFTLSKELNKELETFTKEKKNTIDSLYKDLQIKTQQIALKEKKTKEDIEQLAIAEQLYYNKQQLFEKESQTASAEYLGKIWNQLNQFVQDYGKEKKYSIIFGANGQGNVMYGQEAKNITDEIIVYVNNKYNNK